MDYCQWNHGGGGGGGIIRALNTHVYGNGSQNLVLAHGYGSDRTVWHYLIPLLAYYFKVVVFDLAFSPNVDPELYNPKRYTSDFNGYAEDLVCLLDELNVKRTIYVGHSMSAMVGCVAAIKRPDLFKHLILLSGSPRYLNTTGYTGGFSRPKVNVIFEQIDKNFSSWIQSFVPQAVGAKNTTAIVEVERSFHRMKPEIALHAAESVFLTDLRKVLPKVMVQTSIIQSRKNIVVPESVAFYMKRRLGAPAKVTILDTEGHFPQLTAYPLLSKVLKRVLHIK